MDKERRKLFEDFCGIAKDVLQRNKKHLPQLVLISEKRKEMIPVAFGEFDEEMKTKTPEIIKRLIKKYQIDFYLFIVEGWMLKVDKEKGMKFALMPSKNPERIEVLMISYFSEKDKFQRVIEFTRDDKDKIVFGEILDTEEFDSKFNAYQS